MDRMDRMDVLYLVTDFLCKKQIEENKINSYEQYYALIILSVLSTTTLLYNVYSYLKLSKKYEELKKKAGFDETIKNVYNNLVNITESEEDSEEEEESEDDDEEEEGEYDMEDVDLKK